MKKKAVSALITLSILCSVAAPALAVSGMDSSEVKTAVISENETIEDLLPTEEAIATEVPLVNDESLPVENLIATEQVPETTAQESGLTGDMGITEDDMSCGDSAVWSYDNNGTLTISGSGAINDYSSSNIPWYAYKTSITKIVIKEGITQIGNYNFYGCDALYEIEMSNTVETIGDYAFRNCVNLVDVDIPEGVKIIGDNTFKGCTGIETVTFNGSLESIGSNAFSGCTLIKEVSTPSVEAWLKTSFTNNLSNPIYYAKNLIIDGEMKPEIDIPDTITEISAYAFYNYTGLKTLNLPKTITAIGSSAFFGCSNLTDVNIPTLESWIEIEFTDNMSNPMYYAKNVYINGSAVTDLVIPESVTEIKNYAFYNWKSIVNITIHNGVNKIGSSVFSGCSSVETIALPFIGQSAVEPQKITYLFNSVPKSLINVRITGENQTEVADGAFKNCQYITDINLPRSVTRIGKEAFSGCKSMVIVGLPSSIRDIDEDAFYNCTALDTMVLADINLWYSVKLGNQYSNPMCYAKNAYENKEPITALLIPDTIEEISPYAFYNWNGITDVIVPDSVKHIGTDAFFGCTSLLNVYTMRDESWYNIIFDSEYSSPMSYAQNIYANSKPITSIDIPSTITSISAYTFLGWNKVKKVTIPESVTKIGKDAFKNCSSIQDLYIANMKYLFNVDFESQYSNPMNYAKNLYADNIEVTDLQIPEDVTRIKPYTYTGWTKNETITIPDGVTEIRENSFFACQGIKKIQIPKTVLSIGEKAFGECNSLVELELPFLGQYAGKTGRFAYIFGIVPESVKSVILDESDVTTIADYAFENCPNVSAVTLPDNIDIIGIGAFSDCVSLESFLIPKSTATIANSAFSGCIKLSSLTFNENITNIGTKAFDGCTALEDIYISNLKVWENISFAHTADYYTKPLECIDSSNPMVYADYMHIGRDVITDIVIPDYMTDIPADLFKGWGCLETVTMHGNVNSIGKNAFMGCKRLREIVIPDSADNVGIYAFRDCSSLKSAIIGKNVETIDIGAFYSCTALENVTIGENVKTIETGAFALCEKLVDTVIPESVTTIEDFAFNRCSSIENVIIPKNVISIGESAYSGCSSLLNLTFSAGNIEIGQQAFENCDALVNVYIPNLSDWYSIRFTYPESDTEYVVKTTYTSNPMYYAENIYVDNKIINEISIDQGESIDQYRFLNWKSLNSVYITDGITDIARGAFYGCEGLEKLYLTDGLKTVNMGAFYGCTSLSDINITSLEKWCQITFDSEYSTPMYYAKSVYENGVLLKSPTIPTNISKLKEYTFYGWDCITNINIPQNITELGEYSLAKCTGIDTLVIPDNVLKINAFALNGCTKIRKITLPFIGMTKDEIKGSYTSVFGYIFGYSTGSSKDAIMQPSSTRNYYYYIPLSISNVILTNMTKIKDNAFYNCTNLSSITMTNDIREIGLNAFYNCTAMDFVSYKGTEQQWNYIYWYSGNDSLKNAKVIIGDQEVVVRSGECGESLTWERTNYYNFYIKGSGGMTDYNGNSPWQRYTNAIDSVFIEEGVTKIGNYSFYNCAFTKNVDIPTTITEIGKNAFYGCSSLTSLVLYANVKSIGRDAFSNSGITDIYYVGNEEEWNKISGVENIADTINVHFLQNRAPAIVVEENGDRLSVSVMPEKLYKNSKIYASILDSEGRTVGLEIADVNTLGVTSLDISKAGGTLLKIYVWTNDMRSINKVWQKIL